MAFRQFPTQQYFRILETGENAKMGYFNTAEGTELKHMMITLYMNGVINIPFNIRANIYGSTIQANPIFSSAWAEIGPETILAEDGSAYENNWLGNIYLDFSGNPINPNINYFMSIETDGYARDGDIFYLGLNLDWYSPVSIPVIENEVGMRIRLLGKR